MKKNTLLWEIRGGKLKSPCYVFGTMHVQDERAFRGIDFIEECVASCEAFAAEYDLETDNMADFHRVTMLPEGDTISNLLSRSVYKKLTKVFKRETGYDLQQFDQQKPIMIINMLTSSQFSDDRAVSLDSHLHQFAKQNEKVLLGLESFESQLKILEDMPIKDQLVQLKDMTTNFSRFRRGLLKTAALYVEGDLMKILKKVKKTAGSMRATLLYDRNIIMADKIEELGSQYSLFAAVGAGHLGGKKGVLRLLKSKGCEVLDVRY